MPPEDNSRIEELKKSLYSRSASDVRTRRKLRFSDMSTEVQSGWKEEPEDGEPKEEVKLTDKYKDNSMSILTKLFIGSILFCVIAVGIGAYLFYNGANLISANNIDISVSGPISVSGGAPATFDIMVTNKNSIDLDMVDLAVIFPAGATSPSNPTQELATQRELLGSIPSGGSARKSIQAMIFGEQNTQKTIVIDVTYQVKGSSSSFTKEKAYDVLINSSPVNLTVSSFKEITSGQEFDLKINVKSNSTEVLKNILVSATYPFGFTYISSTIKPLPDNATWRLGDIPPGGERNITVHGKLQGENQEIRVFHIDVGAQNQKNPNSIGTEYMSAVQEVALQKSFMTIGVSLDGNRATEDAAGTFNQPVRVNVSWFNNLPNAVSDAEVSVKLSGSAYDRTMVEPGEGYFRSSSDEILWNSQTTPKLTAVGAGEEGTVSFMVTPRDLSVSGRPIVNPRLTFTVSVNGKRTQESGVPEKLSAIVVRNAKISSVASLSGRIVRSLGSFANTGPIPPKADQKTTYTVIWTVDNTANTLNGARVTAVLPPNVKWLSNFIPSTEDISYDQKTGIVTWNVGTVGTYTATGGQRKEVAFQISLEPNVNQVGSAPLLVDQAVLTGVDDFTGVTLQSIQGQLTTRFSTDPTYKEGFEMVVK